MRKLLGNIIRINKRKNTQTNDTQTNNVKTNSTKTNNIKTNNTSIKFIKWNGFVYLFITVLLILSLTACSNNNNSESYSDKYNVTPDVSDTPSNTESSNNTEIPNNTIKPSSTPKDAEPTNGEDTQNNDNNSTNPSESGLDDSNPNDNANDLNSDDDSSNDTSDNQSLDEQVQQKLSEMTLEEKVAQLFIITPEALTGYKTVVAAGDVTRDALKKYPVGGIVYFGQNVVDPSQLTKMTTNTQNYAKEIEGLPIFLAIDEEGGSVARIGKNGNFDVKTYTDMASIGATKDINEAYDVGNTIGAYLKKYGLNLDFAPDADVLTNPNNNVIGSRSFGSDGNLVADMDLQVAKGLSENSVLSCFKHFPGHGATEGDTHEGFAYTDKTLKELESNELIPFQVAAQNDIPFIMISHISVPKVIGDNTPSSLSKKMVTDILREQLGYEGIIITDSMSMGAIINTYGSKEAVIKALQAGVDMILMPQDFKEAYEGVLKAIADGTLSQDRIDESLMRILRVKFQMSH